MSSDQPLRRVRDIIENARDIAEFTGGMDFAAFVNDRKTIAAVERCLQRISEAATKLGDFAVLVMPEQDWRNIRGLGNHLRHAYDRISIDDIWEIVQNRVPRLACACEAALARMGSDQPL